MTKLEQIAIEKLLIHIDKIRSLCDVKNADKMNSQRPFILTEVNQLNYVVQALLDNNETDEKQIIDARYNASEM